MRDAIDTALDDIRKLLPEQRAQAIQEVWETHAPEAWQHERCPHFVQTRGVIRRWPVRLTFQELSWVLHHVRKILTIEERCREAQARYFVAYRATRFGHEKLVPEKGTFGLRWRRPEDQRLSVATLYRGVMAWADALVPLVGPDPLYPQEREPTPRTMKAPDSVRAFPVIGNMRVHGKLEERGLKSPYEPLMDLEGIVVQYLDTNTWAEDLDGTTATIHLLFPERKTSHDDSLA